MVKFLGNNIMKIMANITKHQIDSSGFGPTFLLSQKVLFSESQPLKVTALVSQLRKSEISLSGESTLRVERKTKATMISATLIMSLWLPGRFKNTVLTLSIIKRFLHSFLFFHRDLLQQCNSSHHLNESDDLINAQTWKTEDRIYI